MARHATIIGHCHDMTGDLWDIREARPTRHGFSILIGWPAGCRGPGYGGPGVIPTPELFAYWDARRLHRDNSVYDLPVARSTIKRVRKLFGINFYLEHQQWWLERLEDLATLPGADFACKYHRHEGVVGVAHKALFGRRLRKPGWHLEPAALSLLVGELPHAVVAERLGIALGSARRLRSILRRRLCGKIIAERPHHLFFRPDITIDAVVSLRKRGKKYREIAQQLGCSLPTVCLRLRQAHAAGLLPPGICRPRQPNRT